MVRVPSLCLSSVLSVEGSHLPDRTLLNLWITHSETFSPSFTVPSSVKLETPLNLYRTLPYPTESSDTRRTVSRLNPLKDSRTTSHTGTSLPLAIDPPEFRKRTRLRRQSLPEPIHQLVHETSFRRVSTWTLRSQMAITLLSGIRPVEEIQSQKSIFFTTHTHVYTDT